MGPTRRAKKCVDQKNRPLADKGDSADRTHVAWEICLAPVQVQKHAVGMRGVPADLILQSARSATVVAGKTDESGIRRDWICIKSRVETA